MELLHINAMKSPMSFLNGVVRAGACRVLGPKSRVTGSGKKLLLLMIGAACLAGLSTSLSAQSQRTPVNLGAAGNYVILSESGITNVPPSVIVGNIGSSPITGAAIHVTCPEVTGTISSVDAAGPAPCALIAPVPLGVAILNMHTAYADAAGRTVPDATELGAGNISGQVIQPGLYKWSSNVLVDGSGVTLTGGPNAVWIFQIAGDLLLASGAHINLSGGAQANNVFWQVGGPTAVTIGSGATFAGNILSAAQVILNTGASLNGRAYAYTQVTLQSNSVSNPGLLVNGIPVPVPPMVTSTLPANLATLVPSSSNVSATFNTAMNPATLTSSTFLVMNGSVPITGIVTYSGLTATFQPTAPLPLSAALTATITTGAQDVSGAALGADYVWTFSTAVPVDTVRPTVTFTTPNDGAVGVSFRPQDALTATFSKPMAPATINSATFLLQGGSASIPGVVTSLGAIATFTPASALSANTVYTATITTGATDLAGNALLAPYSWSFTTGSAPDTTRPTVISNTPSNGALRVNRNESVTVTFSEEMAPASINTSSISLRQGNNQIFGFVSYSATVATFTPAAALTPNTVYFATVTRDATDVAGNALLVEYTWTFTTEAAGDLTRPTVISTTPASGATLVTTTTDVMAVFSKPMDPLTINKTTFLLTKDGVAVSGTVTYTGVTATFRPASNLAPNATYTASITTTAADLAGNTLSSTYQWTFTTGTAAGQEPLCLPNFAVLSGLSIIGTGMNVITGDMGVSPGISLTGFPPGTFTGSLHAGDAAAAAAIADANISYTDALARSLGLVSISGDIGGQTFTAGLYQASSPLSIASGDVTLDAKGDPNAIFIFRTASTFSLSPARAIVLKGGAQASNIFWQVGSSVTLGSTSTFQGSILAGDSVTVGTGATVYGRLFARAGTITLQSAVITSPGPSVAVGGIYNTASWASPVAAGSIAAVFGANFGSPAIASGYPLPLILGGGSIRVGNQNAPLFMMSCRQANVQIPWEVVGQTQLSVSGVVGDQVSAAQTATLVAFSPGIFAMNMLGTGQGLVQISPTTQLAAPLGSLGRPVARGEYILIYTTGLGPVSNQPATGAAALSSPLSRTPTMPTVTIGGSAAQVTYSGLAPGFAGLYQVNAIIPAGAPSGDSVELVLSMGGVTANTVTIAVQ